MEAAVKTEEAAAAVEGPVLSAVDLHKPLSPGMEYYFFCTLRPVRDNPVFLERKLKPRGLF